MGDFNLAEAIVEFTSGVETNWNTFNLAIPENIIIFTTDTMKFKRGDGVHKYSDLPESASIAGIAAGSATLVNVLVRLVAGDENKIIIVDNEIYKASGTLIADVLTRINAIQNKDTVQSANLSTVTSQFSMVDPSISGSDDGKLVITKNHQLSPGALPTDISIVIPPSPLHITRNGIYDNIQLSSGPIWLHSSTTYYYKINACHDVVDTDSLSYTLTSDVGSDITIAELGRGLFKVVVNAVEFNKSVTFTATAIYNADTVVKSTSKVILGYSPVVVSTSLLAAVYGGVNSENWNAVAVDSEDNLICVGATTSEGANIPSINHCLIAKFDKDLNVLFKKTYGGASYDTFTGVTVDSNDNIFVIGNTQSDGVGSPTTTNALVIKFDSSLNILVRKVSQGAYQEFFYGVAVDSANNVICCGYNTTEGVNAPNTWACYVVKFDNALVKIASKVYSGTTHGNFASVVTDSSGNIICVGHVYEGTGAPNYWNALVVKFDTNLNILARKIYGGPYGDAFYSVAVDSNNNIICVGYVYSEGVSSPTYWSGLVMKFDNNLNILARKYYSSVASHVAFVAVAVDSDNNIICVGSNKAEGVVVGTNSEALTVKFDSNLNALYKKNFGCANANEQFNGVTIDSDDNIIGVGSTSGEGAGSNDALMLKLPPTIPAGTFVGTVMTKLVLHDSTLTLANSNLTLTDSALTLGASTVAYGTSALTLAASNLSSEIEDFGTGGFIYRDIMAAVYGGANDDQFLALTIDSNDNIICVGNTNSDGAGIPTKANALVIKFDSNLNILARKIYQFAGWSCFYTVTTDSSDNVICAGFVYTGLTDSIMYGAVVKFDSDLNILLHKYIGASPYHTELRGIAVDSSDNIICVGHFAHSNDGTIRYALIWKLSSSLVELYQKWYNGTQMEWLLSVVVDSSDNIICAGYTNSEGAGAPTYNKAIVLKFDSSLNILARKIYGGANNDLFYGVAVDANGNVICVGDTYSEGVGSPTYDSGLVVKFDPNLNILARKVYGGANFDYFSKVVTDSNNNIICVGHTYSEGVGSPTLRNTLIVKFDANLNILARKLYGGVYDDYPYGVALDSGDNIVVCGNTGSEGPGGANGLVLKLPTNMPSGTFVGTVLTGLTLSDSNLTLANSTLTLAESALTLSGSGLTYGDIGAYTANSVLTLEKDLITL